MGGGSAGEAVGIWGGSSVTGWLLGGVQVTVMLKRAVKDWPGDTKGQEPVTSALVGAAMGSSAHRLASAGA